MSNSSRIRRARTGCRNCKQRRRKCTEDRPQCLACQKRGLQCQYGQDLIWAEDVVEVLAVDEFAWTQLPKRPATWTRPEDDSSDAEEEDLPKYDTVHFVNTSTEDILLIVGPVNPNQPTSSIDLDSTSRFPTPFSRALSLFGPVLDHSDESSLLLEYYTTNFCRRKVLVDGPDNEYRCLILPMLLNSAGLKHAVLALAAFDYPSMGSNSQRFRSLALRHKSRCLSVLQQKVQNLITMGEDATTEGTQLAAELNETLLTVLIMCVSDITTGSTKEWVAHLHGASTLIKMICNKRLANDAVLQFARAYFLARDAFSCTAADAESFFYNGSSTSSAGTSRVPLQGLLQTSFHSEGQADSPYVNVHVGCSERLISIISAITGLAREKYRARKTTGISLAEEQNFLMTATAIQCKLDQLEEKCVKNYRQGTLAGDGLTRGDKEQQKINLYSLLFKRAAHLYLRHAGFDLPITHPTIQNSLLPSLLSLITEVDIQERTVYPMWPLFIAACVTVSEGDRRIILDQFERLREVWKLGNVGVTVEAVHWIWKCYDISSDAGGTVSGKNYPQESKRLGLEWDAPINRLGWRISLT